MLKALNPIGLYRFHYSLTTIVLLQRNKKHLFEVKMISFANDTLRVILPIEITQTYLDKILETYHIIVDNRLYNSRIRESLFMKLFFHRK